MLQATLWRRSLRILSITVLNCVVCEKTLSATKLLFTFLMRRAIAVSTGRFLCFYEVSGDFSLICASFNEDRINEMDIIDDSVSDFD